MTFVEVIDAVRKGSATKFFIFHCGFVAFEKVKNIRSRTRIMQKLSAAKYQREF